MVTLGRLQRPIVALLSALVAVSAAGCNLLLSDEYTWRGVWLANETGSPVLVDGEHMGQYLVDPGRAFPLWAEQHTFRAEVTIMTLACEVIATDGSWIDTDTLVRVTSQGLEWVIDRSQIPTDARGLEEAPGWPCP